MVRRWNRTAARLTRIGAIGGVLVACSSDADCILLPCVPPEAATVSVTASNAPDGIAGLVATTTGAVTSTGPCDQAPVSVCHIPGGPGTYQVQLSAPGYQSAQLTLTITGTEAGCNTCGRVDRQDVQVELVPVT
jgi:hypothetical protein